jgi:hypothetical protein
VIRSIPSPARQIAAGVAMATGAGYVAVVKLTRGGECPLAPPWLAGVLPNVVCGFAVPLVVFLTGRVLRVADFLWMASFTLAGLCLYEVAQVWMPRRTFDWADVGATVVGVLLALVVGAAFFFVTREKPAGPGAAPDRGPGSGPE